MTGAAADCGRLGFAFAVVGAGFGSAPRALTSAAEVWTAGAGAGGAAGAAAGGLGAGWAEAGGSTQPLAF
jgi:hypothetical protein